MDMLVVSQQILGPYLDGIQAGNEPDQYNFNNRSIRNVNLYRLSPSSNANEYPYPD